VDLVGQAAADTAHAITDVVRRFVGVDVLPEANGDAARFGSAGRLQDVDACDSGNRAFEHLGDLGLDDVRRRTGVGGRDGNRRLVHVRVFADGQSGVGNETEQDQNEAQDRREDGPANADLDGIHQLFSSWRVVCDWTT